MRKAARQKLPGGPRAGRRPRRGCSTEPDYPMTTTRGSEAERRGFGGGWPDGRRRGEERASGRVVGWIRTLDCRSEPLGRSDRGPTGGADEREEVVSAYENRLYTA